MADPKAAVLLATFAIFVSCVEGQPVARFGTGTMIGASRTPDDPTVVVYDPEEIVAIPHAEYSKHRRAYDRAIANGSLRVRKSDKWVKQEQTRSKGKAEARQKKQAEAKAKAEKAAQATEQAEASAPAATDDADASAATDTV
jgi:hypothetical protein